MSTEWEEQGKKGKRKAEIGDSKKDAARGLIDVCLFYVILTL